MASTFAAPLRKALETNSTATSFTAKIPTTTAPTGTGVFDLTDSTYGMGVNGCVPEYLMLLPYGGNDNDETFSMRLWGWSRTIGAEGTALWVPQLLVELAVTLSSSSGAAIGTGMLMADTLVATYGITDEKILGVSLMAPANNVPAAAWVNLRGCQRIEFDFDSTGNDAQNCFWRPVDRLL